MAAGESLHALLLLMIGRTSQQTDDMASKAPMVELFKRVFPVVLKLASDSDSVIQGKFICKLRLFLRHNLIRKF